MSNELVILKNNRSLTTSLIVAEVFEKRHDNVLQSIKEMSCTPEFSQLNFQEAYYLDAQGKERIMYNLTRDGFSFLAMGFKGERAAIFKEQFIREFNKREEMLKSDDYILSRAFELLAEKNKRLEETCTQKQQQIEIMHPKAEYVDKVLSSDNSMNIGTIAKDLGMSAVALNTLLHQKGIQYRSTDGLWILYAKYQDRGYTKIETTTQISSEGKIKTYHHLKWTERGKAFINWIVNPTIHKKPIDNASVGVQVRT